jgi:hypothetical protein
MMHMCLLFSQTFPTNSGPNPVGAEQLARSYAGMNAMNPKCAASLMMEIVSGSKRFFTMHEPSLFARRTDSS